jgi:hypothetical protein
MTVIAAPDVFVDNDVYSLSRTQHPRLRALGGVAWLARQSPAAAHLIAIEVAVSVVKRALHSYRLWLLAAHTAVQPNGVVARHNRLWKSLAAQGLEVPGGLRVEEVSREEDGGRRWFSAVECVAEDLAMVMKIIEEEAASVLVAVPANSRHEVEMLVATGWASPRQGPPPEMLEWLAPLEGVAFWPVGAFDDVESGIVAFCSPRIVALLEKTGEL